jgi:uncharacterized damage-inducible protein DinB
MNAIDIILQSLEENEKYVQDALTFLTEKELAWSPEPHSNSIIFLLWHLGRVEDLWINRILKGGKDQYETEGWYKKFSTAALDGGMGYDVAKLKAWPVPSLKLVNEYKAAVRKTVVAYISSLTEKQLDEPRDFGWSKGTTGSALKHLICEVGEHSGQIGYIKGIMKGIEQPPEFRKKK